MHFYSWIIPYVDAYKSHLLKLMYKNKINETSVGEIK